MIAPPAFGLLMIGLFIVGFVKKTGLVAGAIWFETTCPERSERVFNAYTRRAGLCVLLGAAVGLPALIAGGALLFFGGFGLRAAGGLLIIAAVFLMAYGHGAAYLDAGRRLQGAFRAESAPAVILTGGAVLEMAFLAPVAGQILAAVVWMRCLGAAVLALTGASAVGPAHE